MNFQKKAFIQSLNKLNDAIGTSTNQAIVPQIRNLRVIALA